jgi:hypothetical protein
MTNPPTIQPSAATRARARLASAVCLAVFTALLLATPAHALTQHGHSFGFSFGATGTGAGQYEDPSSFAVSERTGDLYVSDAANDRIDQFQPQTDGHGTIVGYTFERAFGWGVADGEKRYETCEAACKPGIAGAKFFKDPGQIAIDNSTDPTDPSRGDLYVVANHLYEEKARVYELGPEGEPVSTTEQHGPEGAPAGQPLPAGQAPMALGTIEEEIQPGKWKRNEELAEEEIGDELEVIVGVAVDAHGLVWLYGEDGDFRALAPDGALTPDEPALEPSSLGLHSAPGRSGIAVQTLTLGEDGSVHQDRLYAGYEPEGEASEGKDPKHGFCSTHPCRTAELDAFEVAENPREHIVEEEEGQILDPALTGAPTRAAAVDPVSGDAYLDTPTSITALDPTGAQVQVLGGPEGGFPGLQQAGALAVDHAGAGEGGELYVFDAATGQIDVFAPAPPGPPALDTVSTHQVAATSARLDAEVDPDGAPTTYTLQYTSTPCTETPAECAAHFTCTAGPESCGELPDPPGDAGSGFGDTPVSVTIAGLKPATTYQYRFTAINAHGHAVSQQQAFSTPPAAGAAITDERVWEMVSPPDKGGAQALPLTHEGGVVQAAADGAALAYLTDAPIGQPEGSRSFEPAQNLATRTAAGWSSSDIDTANEHGTGLRTGKAPEYQFFSTDLSLALVNPTYPGDSPLAEPPLSPPLSQAETGAQEKTPYLRADAPAPPGASPEVQAIHTQAEANALAMHNAGFLALITAADVPAGTAFGSGELEFLTATPDLSHVLFASRSVKLTAGSGGDGNLYEWAAGHLTLVSVLPGPSALPAEGPLLGDDDRDLRNAVSEDGTHVFFASGEHLYMRDTATEQTVQVDTMQPGGSESDPQHPADAVFQGASSNGATVLFTDTQRLTEHAGARLHDPDLYACEIHQDSEGAPTCDVTDLTPEHAGESAAVQGLVLGASTDAGTVYFVANAVLSSQAAAAGASPGLCVKQPPAATRATCNLYMVRAGATGWQPPTFIATLSNLDEPDWQGPHGKLELGDDLGEVTSAVSPDGSHLAFMSERPLTGYDNEDIASVQPGERLDEEVFLYHAPPGEAEPASLICASCDPSGARPAGVLDPTGEASLLVDRAQSWQGQWLAASLPGSVKVSKEYALHQPRLLADSGRLFFDSPADLVPEATNGKEDVYEYEPEGVPAGEHRCTGATQTFTAPAHGCVGLISSGSSQTESAFLDASETGGEGPGEHEGGGDVFFITAATLVPQDVDQSYDVYDAHECTTGSPCDVPALEQPPAVCESTDACRPLPPSGPPATTAPASAAIAASGNLTPHQKVLATKTTVKSKSPTRAQLLSRALAQCHRGYRHSRTKRHACERRARKRYGPIGRPRHDARPKRATHAHGRSR